MRPTRVLRSPAIRAALVFGVAGVGFAGANLLLARFLSKTDFGVVTLALTLQSVGLHMAPMGAEGLVNRRALDFGRPLLWRALWTSALCAVGTLGVSRFWYGMDAGVCAALGAGIVGGGTNLVASAKFQSLQHFRMSLGLNQSSNATLLVAALIALPLAIHEPWFPVAVVAAGYAATASLAWRALLRRRATTSGSYEPFVWQAALAYAGVNAAGLLLSQLERLVVPSVLSLEHVATFGVLAAVLIAPFRSLQMGVSYTLLPRMRAAVDSEARRRLLLREGATFGALAGSTAVVAWWLTPWLVHLFVGAKYTLDPPLLLAALAGGILRVMSGFGKGVVTALGTDAELARVNALMWLAILVGIAGSILASRWGLAGVVWAVNLAWACNIAIALHTALPHLQDAPPAAVPKPLAR